MSRRERRCREERVEAVESRDCKLIIVPTLCFSDVECFEDTVRFENLNPAPALVPPLETRVFVIDFCARFIDSDTIRKTVKFRVFIRYLAENGTTVERTIDRTFTQDVDVSGQCEPDVCADDKHSSFLCRVTDLCVRRSCLEDDEDIVVDIVGRLSLELFVKQRLCVRLCPENRCPQGIEAAELCIENNDCVPCSREEAEESRECRRCR